MKRIASSLILLVALFAGAALASEDWRGQNRLAGTITDANGKPVKGAVIALRLQKGSSSGPDVKADDHGKWAMLGLGAGSWNIDVSAPGFQTKQLSVSISEGERLPPMKIALDAAQVQQAETAATPSEAPVQEVKIGGVAVTQDIADAVEAGNKALGEKNFKEAVANYEKAYPTLSANLPLKQALARAYYGAGDLKKAVVLMDEMYKADPSNVPNALLYAELLLEDGQLDKGKDVVEKLPADALKDPTALINIGILMLNKKQPAAARDYFTKAIAVDGNRAETYYYRGLSEVQLNKMKDAKADLEKTVSLAPASSEAKEAAELLKSIK
ncbi:MAG: Carboxypeptidase regulatory-like domain [Acidobacteriota bacterium]|nr:Carboxypeptidase regulatory-like domain [Acidobacteriota bacterium]